MNKVGHGFCLVVGLSYFVVDRTQVDWFNLLTYKPTHRPTRTQTSQCPPCKFKLGRNITGGKPHVWYLKGKDRRDQKPNFITLNGESLWYYVRTVVCIHTTNRTKGEEGRESKR